MKSTLLLWGYYVGSKENQVKRIGQTKIFMKIWDDFRYKKLRIWELSDPHNILRLNICMWDPQLDDLWPLSL